MKHIDARKNNGDHMKIQDCYRTNQKYRILQDMENNTGFYRKYRTAGRTVLGIEAAYGFQFVIRPMRLISNPTKFCNVM
jgi:hypothetical protein